MKRIAEHIIAIAIVAGIIGGIAALCSLDDKREKWEYTYTIKGCLPD